MLYVWTLNLPRPVDLLAGAGLGRVGQIRALSGDIDQDALDALTSNAWALDPEARTVRLSAAASASVLIFPPGSGTVPDGFESTFAVHIRPYTSVGCQ